MSSALPSAYPAETNDGKVTSYVALTVSWTSVQGCSNSYALEGDRLVAFDPGYGISIQPGLRCQPNAVTTWWNQGNLGGGGGNGGTAVSLGPVTCPDAWNTVDTFVRDSTSTQIMCCPPGYELTNADSGSTGVAGDCISSVASGSVLPYAEGSGSNYIFTSTTLDADSTVGAIGVVGWNIQQTLQAAVSTNTVPSILASTSISSPTSSSAASTATPINPSEASSGLSTAAKAGIGVGAGIGVLIIVSLIAWVAILKRKRGKENMAGPLGNTQPYYQGPDGDVNPYKPRELAGNEMQHRPGYNSAAKHQDYYAPQFQELADRQSRTIGGERHELQ